MIDLPKGFTRCGDAAQSNPPTQRYCFIGILLQDVTPFKTKGSDYALDFTIQDDFEPGGSNSTMRFRFFRRSADDLPSGKLGDVVIVYDAKVSPYAGQLNVVSNATARSYALFFSSKDISPPQLSSSIQAGTARTPYHGTKPMRSPSPTTLEHVAVVHMKESAKSYLELLQHAPVSPPAKKSPASHPATTWKAPQPSRADRSVLIKDIALYKYHDIRGQVIKMFYSSLGSTTDVYVTDYTENKSLYNYQDPADAEIQDLGRGRAWNGPYGQLILQVRLYGAHAIWARENVSEGDYYLLRNIRIRLSQENKLEGAMHEDHVNPFQVDIRTLTSESEIDAIKERREKYEAQRMKRLASPNVSSNVPVKASAKSKMKKKEKQLEKYQQERMAEEMLEIDEAERAGTNINVRSVNPDISLSTLADIVYNPSLQYRTPDGVKIDLPFVNCKYRARVRVVDFYPPDLRDFIHWKSDCEWNPPTKQADYIRDHWEWAFMLLLEDANLQPGSEPVRLRTVITNKAAQYLIKMDAADPDDDPKLLLQLKEKMHILWGNLQELKEELEPMGVKFPLPAGDARLSNKPFVCCIEEYGVEVPVSSRDIYGWQRTHGLFSTTIT